MIAFLKKNSVKILGIASLVLHLLGGSGIVKPPFEKVGNAVIDALSGK
jgi:hypothetical protein